MPQLRLRIFFCLVVFIKDWPINVPTMPFYLDLGFQFLFQKRIPVKGLVTFDHGVQEYLVPSTEKSKSFESKHLIDF